MMIGWIRMFWFAVSVVIALLLFTHDGVFGIGAAVVWALIVAPVLGLLAVRHGRGGADGNDVAPVAYWRTGDWQSGTR